MLAGGDKESPGRCCCPVRNLRKILLGFVVVAVVAGSVAGVVAYRGMRAVRMAQGLRTHIRYLIENGVSVGESPAAEVLSDNYLGGIFSDNPELLDKLRGIIAKGLSEEPSLRLGEVAAMVITYHRVDDKTEGVVAHIVGAFPLGKRRLGFHRDGWFKGRLDQGLWNSGNLAVSFLGREIVLFSEEAVAEKQQAVLESLLSGDITPLIQDLKNPLFFTIVIPEPGKLVPPQLRSHIQAMIFKGRLGYDTGVLETILLCSSVDSAEYTFAISQDLKTMADLALQIQFQGMEVDTEWGRRVGVWWAYEMAQTLRKAVFRRDGSLVRAKSEFGRVMVNAFLKSIERMSRDVAQMRMSLDQGMDPRLVDARLQTPSYGHYWSQPHQWGPDWPIPPPKENVEDETNSIPGTTTQAVTAALGPP